jgi:N-acetylmuramoyl-L-alanine amidase
LGRGLAGDDEPVLSRTHRVATIVPRHRLTRRQALKLGAATAALGALRPAPSALASPTPEAFALDLPSPAAAASGWRTSPVYDAPRRFDLIGLGWRRGGSLDAQVRARRRGGRWSRWTPLHHVGGHGPDAGRGVAGTDPAWTGAADQFQLRLRGTARGLRARFVRSGPAAHATRSVARAAKRQIPGAPVIIPRAEWGGDAVAPRSAPAYGQVQLAFVHHTVNVNDYGPEDSAAMVLGIAKYHRDHLGWNDLGYNFLVDQYGQIFEGRAGGIDLAIVGAQAQGFNSVSTGVACLGTFTAVALPEAALDAVARLIGWKLSFHAIPVAGAVTVTSAGGETNRYSAGTPVTFERISGHRDGNSTSCPGTVLYGQLADIRARAAGYAGPAAGVTVHAARTRLRGSATATLSGSLRFADGSSAAGAPVEVLYASTGSGGAYAPLVRVFCGVDGSWSATVQVPRTGTIRARFPGDATRAPLESSSLRITLEPRLSLFLSSRRIRAGRRIRVSGYLAPATSADVKLAVYRKVGGRYRRVRSRRLPVRDTRFRSFLRLTRPGLYRVVVSVDGALTRQYLRVS